MKYTFEFIQKVMLNVNGEKLKPDILSLKKLYYESSVTHKYSWQKDLADLLKLLQFRGKA